MASAPRLEPCDPIDRELESILTSFDASYVWSYGSLEEGLRELYEKAKR